MDMERSNPFLDAIHVDPDLDSEMEAGDEHEGETLPFNWYGVFPLFTAVQDEPHRT